MRSRACGPARRSDGSQPRNWARRTFLSGKSNDARDGTPAHARPHVRSSAQKALVRTSHTEKCLRSRCAGAAALVVSAITAGIARVVSLVTAAAAPPPVTAPLRAVTRPSAAFVRAVTGPRLRPQGAYCARFGRSLFGRHVGCPWVARGPAESAFSRSGTCLCAVFGACRAQGGIETVEMVPCAHVGSNCVVFCTVSLTVIIDGP